MAKYFNLTNDLLFKNVFKDNNNLKFLLEDFFMLYPKKITNLNPELLSDYKKGKYGVVDMLIEIDDDLVILELQNKNEYNIDTRLTTYGALVISNHGLNKGEDYNSLKKVKILVIVNYNLLPEFERKWNIIDNKLEYMFDYVEAHVVDLTKKPNRNIKLLDFFKINNNNELEKIKNNNEITNNIKKDIIRYNEDEEMRKRMNDIAQLLLNEKNDYKSVYKHAKQEGEKNGIAIGEKRGEKRGMAIGEKRGEKRGMAIGEKRGEERGMAIGEKRGIENIALNMLKENMDILLISKLTNLSIEKILSLK